MRKTFALLLLVGLVVAVGCGDADLPERVPVHGIVTLDGSPLPLGEITFMPDESQGTVGPSASGVIDAQGHYQLTTNHQKGRADGAIPGFHRVRIVAREITEPGAPSKSHVPARYGDFKTAGLTVEVKAGEENKLDWPLQSR